MAWFTTNNTLPLDSTNKGNTVGSMNGIFFNSEEKTNDLPIMKSPIANSTFHVTIPSTSSTSTKSTSPNKLIPLSLFDNENISNTGAPASVLSQVIIDMFAGTQLSPIAEISTKSGRNNKDTKSGSTISSSLLTTIREREREKPRGYIFTTATSPTSSPMKSESKTSSLEESNYEYIIEKYNKRILEQSTTTETSSSSSSSTSNTSINNPILPRPDAVRNVLLEMDADGVCPNIDTAILSITAFDLAGLGGRTLDVIGTIAQVMLNSGANPVQVRDVVLHPRTVAVMLTATANEGQGTMVRNLWTAYTRASETRRKSTTMLQDLMNGTGYQDTLSKKPSADNQINDTMDSLPAKDAGIADKQCINQLRGLYAMALAIALCRLSSSCPVVHSNILTASTANSPSSTTRINTQLPPSDTLMALHTLLNDCGVSIRPENIYSLDKSTINSNLENTLQSIPATIGAALAIAYRMAGYRIQARKILTSIIQAYAGHTASDTPPYLDSQSFPSLVIALGICNLSNDLRALMVQASARAISTGMDHGPLGSPLLNGSGASTMLAWLGGHIIRTDDTAVSNVWKQLTTSPAMQRMKLLQNVHVHNPSIPSANSSPSELASIPVASIANILVPASLQSRSSNNTNTMAKLPFTTLATGLTTPTTNISTITSSSSTINPKYTFSEDDMYLPSDSPTNNSSELPISKHPVPWIASNMRVAYQVSVGKLRDALIDYLPALPASSKNTSTSPSLPSLYMPIPETVTLLLHAVSADIGPEGKSLSGLRLPQYLVPGLVSSENDNINEISNGNADGNILFEDGTQFIALIQAILSAARAWGLRPRLTDMAAVIEIHGLIGNLRLALGDIRSSPGGPSSLLYASLIRGIARWGAVTFMEAEWVARRAHEDNIDISHAGLAAAVDMLSVRLGADMHPVYRTNKTVGQAASTVIQALAPTAPQSARETASPLTTSIALSGPYIQNTSSAFATSYVLSHYALLHLSDLYVDTNHNQGSNSASDAITVANSIGLLPSNAVSTISTLARSVAEALLSSNSSTGTIVLQENALSTLTSAQEQVPIGTVKMTSPLRDNSSGLRIPDLVDEGHLSAAERNQARNNSSTVPNGFAVFSRGTNNGVSSNDNLPSMIVPGSWKNKSNQVPPATSTKSTGVTTSGNGISSNSSKASSSIVLKGSTETQNSSSSKYLNGTSSTTGSSVTVSSLLRKDCWDYRNLGYTGIAGDLMVQSTATASTDITRNTIPDFGQLVMAIATPAPTFEGTVRALKRAERILGRSNSTGRSIQAEQSVTAIEHRAAMDALPIAAAILRAERAAAINAGRLPSSPERKSTNKMDENILNSSFSTDPDIEMSPDTILLEETCREAHADTARLESELHSVAAQLSSAEATLNSFVHIQWDMATIARALTGHIGNAASTGVKPSAAMLYTSRGTNQALAIEDSNTSSSSTANDSITPLGPIKARTVLRKREAALRGAITRLRSEEEALLNALKEGGGGVAADIYRSHNESMNNMLAACIALDTKIEQDDRKVIAMEDAMLSSRDGLRAWAGIGNRSSLLNKDSANNDSKGNPEEESIATAMDAIAQLSSSLLTQASRQTRVSRAKVRSILDSQLVRAQASVAAVEELAHSQTALNSRLRALVSSFHREIDRMTSLLEEEVGNEDGLRLAVTQLTMKRDQVARKHELEAERVEEAIARMRATLTRELSRRVDTAQSDVSRAMEAASTKGRMSAAVEGAAALEAVRHATELAVAKATQEAAEAISPTVHEQLKAGIRSNMRLEEAIETALAATAGDAGRRRELHARIAAESSLLQAAEVALARARTEADHIVSVDSNLRSLRSGQKEPPVSEIKVPALTSLSNKGLTLGSNDEITTINTAGMSASAQLWTHATNLGLTAFDLCGTVEEAVSTIVPITGNISLTPSNNNTLENLAYGITLGPETDSDTAAAAMYSLDSIINLYEEELAKVRVRSLPSVAQTSNNMGTNSLPLPPDPTRASTGLSGKQLRTNNDNISVPAISVLDSVNPVTVSTNNTVTSSASSIRYNPSLLPSRTPPSIPMQTITSTTKSNNPSSLAIEALANTATITPNMAAMMQVYGINK